jgi:hypothetical protein
MPEELKPLPPCIVADMCLTHAWRDDIDDEVRLVLENAAHWITDLTRRLVENPLRIETLEPSRQ